VHKVYGFAGGLSEAAVAAFERLVVMLQQVEAGSFVADATAAAL
jgi:hypothetical protein